MDGVNPFIGMPRRMCLEILEECDLTKIINSLSACEKLRCISLRLGDSKRVFTDYGKPVTYACVGPQVSRNSQTVLSHPPYMDALPDAHWQSLVWMMKCAERSFPMIADHSVVSHLHHVGILPDGYVRTNPLPQIPTKQSVPTNKDSLPGYFGIPIVIPTLRSLIGPAISKVRTPWLSFH